jgi:small subunit ribosomal protein S21
MLNFLGAEYGGSPQMCQANCKGMKQKKTSLNFSCKYWHDSVLTHSHHQLYNIRRNNGMALNSGGTKGAMSVKEIEVKVIDNDIEKAMRILKKKIQNDGLFKRLKLKKSYEKPSEFRRRKQREAQRRERIAAARAARRR